MRMLHTSTLKKRITGGLLGLSILLGLFTPISFVEAFPLSAVNNKCFQDNIISDAACFPTMAACDAARAAVNSNSECLDSWDKQHWWAKTWSLGNNSMRTAREIKEEGEQWLASKSVAIMLEILEWLGHLLFYIAGLFLTITGTLLDMSIQRTIDHTTYSSLLAVQIGWTTVRDFTNMFFIFVLLYIAILTIVNQASANAKRWVASLIIAALLINFSLFFTQVVIDAGNILAMGFWNKITSVQGGKVVNSAMANFMEGLRVQTNFDTNNTVNKDDPGAISLQKDRIIVYIGGALVMFAAGYVFLAGAILMIIRTLTLLILMIFSPFAFLGFALPKGAGFASQWLGKLVGASFVAPAFIIMLYIDSIIINSLDMQRLGGGQLAKYGLALTGSADNFAIFYQFFILIFLFLAALKVANYVGDGMGKSSEDYMKKGLKYGGMGAGAGAWAAGYTGRQVGGRFGRATAESETLNKMAKSNNRFVRLAANTALAGGRAAKTGTWDIRNAPMGGLGVAAGMKAVGANMGSGSKTTYEKKGGTLAGVYGGYRGTENEEKITKEAKARFPNNAAAQDKYLKDKLGEHYEKPQNKYAEDRNKTTREEVDTKVKKDNAKEELKEKLEQYKEVGTKFGEEAGKKLKEEIEGLFTKLGAKDSVEALGKDRLNDTSIHEILNKQQLAFMATNADKYQETLDKASGTIMASGGEPQRQYVLQQVKMQNPAFQSVNLQDELGKRISAYENEVKSFDPNTTDPVVRKKHFDSLEKHDSAIQDMAGAMKPKDIARLPNELKKKPALVRNYTDKHFNEIESYHKNIVQDADKPEQQQMFADIRTAAQNEGTKGTQEYMGKAKKKSDSVYFDSGSQAQLNQDLVKAKSATIEAEKNLNTAKASGLQGRVADAERAVTQAKNDERTLESKLRNSDSSKNDIGANSGDDEDEV